MSTAIAGRLFQMFLRLPFRVTVPKELGSGAGSAWVGEGAPIPVTSTLFDAMALEYLRLATITLLTRVLFQFGAVTEAAIRTALTYAIKKPLDTQLLDPAATGSASAPASLTSYGTPITSTGTTASAVLADLESLIAAISTPGDGLVWVMRRTTFARIAAKLATLGVSVTPSSLLGIPVIAGSTSPAQIALIDTNSIAVAYDEAIDVDIATQGAVQANSTPSASATTLLSLYQSNVYGIKASLAANWAPIAFNNGSPAQAAGVAWMSVTY